MLKKLLNKFISEDQIPFLVLFLFELCFHIFLLILTGEPKGDDSLTPNLIAQKGLWNYVKEFYLTWGSGALGVCIQAIVCILPDIVWAIVDSAMIVLFVYSVSILLVKEKSAALNWAISGLFLLFPFIVLYTAGWKITTLAYLWPAALGTFSFTLLTRKNDRWYHYVLCGLSMLLSAGSLQLSVVLFVLLLNFLFKAVYKKEKKLFMRTSFLLIIELANLINNIVSPGNRSRMFSETATWNPDFYMRTLIEKMQIGFMETMSNIFLSSNLLTTIIMFLILIVIWKKYKDWIHRLLALIPFFINLGIGTFPSISFAVFPELNCLHPKMSIYKLTIAGDNYYTMNLGNVYEGLVDINNFMSWKSYIPLVVMIICFIVTTFSVFLCFEDLFQSIVSASVFMCGIGSGMIMGFSPTVYASTTRTLSFTFFCFIIIGAMIVEKNREYLRFPEKYKSMGIYFFLALAFFNVFETFMLL